MKSWIGVDLDGTLAQYYGWHADGSIGAPIPRMVQRVEQWLREGRDVRIFTARAHNATQDELATIRAWCWTYLGTELAITCEKDNHMIELWDDRAVQVIPNTGERADGRLD